MKAYRVVLHQQETWYAVGKNLHYLVINNGYIYSYSKRMRVEKCQLLRQNCVLAFNSKICCMYGMHFCSYDLALPNLPTQEKHLSSYFWSDTVLPQMQYLL
jgi:hypothetical protein